MQMLPSDHIIEDEVMFRRAVKNAAEAAAAGALVTFGLEPTHPETGYGYIAGGEGLGTYEGCFSVDSFVEKPDLLTAEGYVKDSGYFWSSGTFLLSANAFLSEYDAFEPDVRRGVEAVVEGAERDLDFLRLVSEPCAALPSKSIAMRS